jgi:hypothetical protein
MSRKIRDAGFEILDGNEIPSHGYRTDDGSL